MGNQFYYTNAAKEVIGPCTTLQLMALHKSGSLTDSSLVCPEGSEEWIELWTIFPAARMSKLKKDSSKGTGSPTAGINENGGSGTTPPATGDEARKPGIPQAATRNQATVIILLILLGLAFPYFGALRPVPKWEYKKVTFSSQGHERIGAGALKYSSIEIDENLLNLMGKEGWEMVGSHLEMETAFPNLGKEDYIAGIHPNIRPQSLVVLFKRPAR